MHFYPCALFFETVLKNCWTVLSQKLSKNERNSEVKVIWKVKVRTIWTYPYASFSGFWRKYVGTVFLNWAKCNGLFETKQQFNIKQSSDLESFYLILKFLNSYKNLQKISVLYLWQNQNSCSQCICLCSGTLGFSSVPVLWYKRGTCTQF